MKIVGEVNHLSILEENFLRKTLFRTLKTFIYFDLEGMIVRMILTEVDKENFSDKIVFDADHKCSWFPPGINEVKGINSTS